MALARFEHDFTDDAGNLIGVAGTVTVRREDTGALAVPYSDRDGTTGLGNPFAVSDGQVAFHVIGGSYKVTLNYGGETRELRYVAIGTGAEYDAEALGKAGYAFEFEAETTAAPSASSIRANNADLSAATKLYIDDETLGLSDISASLLALDPNGNLAKNRIRLTVGAVDAVFDVDGATDQTDYVELDVSNHDGSTSLNVGTCRVNIEWAGADIPDGSITSDKKTAATIAKDEGFADYATMIASGLGYTVLSEDDIIFAGSRRFPYKVAPSGASDHHTQITGGAKLYLVGEAFEPEMLGAVGDGVTDDTTACQNVINAAISSGVKFKYTGTYLLSTVAALPDGHAGDYCLIVDGELVVDGDSQGTFIVPANEHGILVWDTDNVTIQKGRFIKDGGTSGTIGHFVRVLGPRDNIKVNYNRFENASDAAIGFSYDLDSLIASPSEANAFTFGPTNVEIIGNHCDNANGDAMVELQGVTGFVCRDNTGVNLEGHVIRPVGVRQGLVLNNHGKDCGIAGTQSSAVVAAYSGGGTFGGTPLLLKNEDLLIKGNTGENCFDGMWLGIGGKNITAVDNDFEVRQYGCRIGHIGATSPYGLIDSIVSRNTLKGGTHSVYIDTDGATPSGSDPLRDVDLSSNLFTDYSVAGIYENATSGRVNKRVNARDNRYNPTDTSVTSTAVCVQMTAVEDGDFRGSKTSLENGIEFKIFLPTGTTKGPKLTRYKVTRASNTLVRPSGSNVPWKKWQRVNFETTDTLPSPLATDTLYWLFSVTATAARVATTEANATSGIGFSLTDDGTGHHFIVPVDE